MSGQMMSKAIALDAGTAPARSADQLVPALRSRTRETDAYARLPDLTINDLEERGLFRLLCPKALGGEELDPVTYMRTIANLGRGDMSVAWVVAILNACTAMVARTMPEEVCAEVFSSPGSRVAGVFYPRSLKARPEPGGLYIEEGLWAFNSGVEHADWDLLGVPIYDHDGNAADDGLALVPKQDLQLLRDWDTIALRGTGSMAVKVTDVFVKSSWILPFGRLRRENLVADRFRHIWQCHISSSASGALDLIYPAIGAAEGALEIFMEKVHQRGIQYTHYARQAEAPGTHMLIGEASARIDAAKALVLQAIDEMTRTAKSHAMIDTIALARIRRDVGLVSMLLWEAVDRLASASGGSLIGSSNLISRFWKDLKGGASHGAITSSTVFEAYGRQMCGLPSHMTMAGTA